MLAASVVENHGVILLNDAGDQGLHVYGNSSFINTSVFTLSSSTLSGLRILNSGTVTNAGLIIQRQDYAPQAGQTIADVFLVHPWSDAQVHPAWLHPTNNSQVLASYDQTFNEVTFANSLPSGIDRMDILIETTDCGNYASFVDFSQASALSAPTEAMIQSSVTSHELGFTVFPNPIQHQFNATVPLRTFAATVGFL